MELSARSPAHLPSQVMVQTAKRSRPQRHPLGAPLSLRQRRTAHRPRLLLVAHPAHRQMLLLVFHQVVSTEWQQGRRSTFELMVRT